MKKLKDIFHNNWIGCLVFLLLSAWIWTKALHISQNYLITNKNWYATKSKMITNNMMGATAASMSRSAIAGGQINLRHLYGGNEVNFVRGIQFSSLKFDFQVPQNSYLDVTFNITDKTMTAFRISRSSIFPSMSYHATREGKFLTVNSFHIDLSGKGLGRGEIRQTPEGIEFKIDGRKIGLIEGDSILPAEFGFRSGLRGAFVSNVEVKDVSGIKINTELENNKDFWLHFGGHFMAIVVICAFVAGLVWLIRKTPMRRTVFIASSFLFFSGSLWYSFDDYYFARQESDWSKDDEATYRFRNPMSFDFEIYRYKFFAGWKKLWNERPMTLETFVSRYGQSVDEPTYHYCLNERCVHLSERETLSASAKNDKPTLRFGLIGASFSAGSGVINADDSFFVVAHKKVYESYKGQFNIESINYSKTKFSYTKDFISTFELAKKDKINYLIFTKNVDFGHQRDQDESMEQMMELASRAGITPVFLMLHYSPESFMRGNSMAFVDLLFFSSAYETRALAKSQKIYRKFSRKYGTISLNPNPYINRQDIIRSGQLWWDRSHFTSYGYEVYGSWLGNELNSIIATNAGRIK